MPIDKEQCIGCGACVSICPVEAIAMDDDGKAFIKEDICIKCGTCESVCPTSAIDVK